MNLEDGSDIKDWFATLTFEEQAFMRSHYINYLRGIKDGYLGEAWQSKINRVYEGQYFRQVGHERELPKTFIIRRIMYTRMLTSAKPGGKLEISLIMRRAPISWKTILVIGSIKSTKALYTKVVDYEDALLESWRRKTTSATAITVENLLPNLKRLGWEPPRATASRSNQERHPTDWRVMLTVAEEGEEDSRAEDLPAQNDQKVESHDDMLREVYQVMQKRQRAPPPGGYMFSRNDHVTTKMGRLPPSPCQACGSSNHWDKECPDWEVYRAQASNTKRTARATETHADTEEGDKLYQSAYSILLSQRLASSQIDIDRVNSDFKSAVHPSFITALSVEGAKNGRKTGERCLVDIEEVEDESLEELRAMKKSTSHLLIHEDEDHEDDSPPAMKHPTQASHKQPWVSVEEVEDDFWTEYRAKPKSMNHVLSDALEEDDSVFKEPVQTERGVYASEVSQEALTSEKLDHCETSAQLPPPPQETKPIRIPKKRFYPVGESSVGVSVLSVKGWVGHLDNLRTDLQLDSCADITLISEDYYNSLKAKPLIQQGMRMKLWQLTDKDSSLKGFVRIPIFMLTDDGTTIESEAEAYVVPGMTVPILLGEDYQLTYEVGVTRNVEEGPSIHFGKSVHKITAEQVDRTKDFDRLRQSAHSVGKFIRSKLHRRRKNKRHQLKVKFGLEQKVVRAKEDYKIRPHECKRIQIEGQLGEDKDWLVSKNLLSGADDSYFVVPNTLISAANPWVPIANPSNRPRYIRKGEVIGTLSDPEEYFDHVKNLADWEKHCQHAEAIASIIQIQVAADNKQEVEIPHPGNTAGVREGASDLDEVDESFGPKTAEMPDLAEFPSSRMRDFIDVGSLLDHLRDKAWSMLERRVKAFGFDGRLGHLEAKVHIRTQDGQVPISVPMYGSSPEK